MLRQRTIVVALTAVAISSTTSATVAGGAAGIATSDGAAAEVWATETPSGGAPQRRSGGPRTKCTYYRAAGNLNSIAVGEPATDVQPGQVVIRICRDIDTGRATSGPDFVTIAEPADINPLPGLIDRARTALRLPSPSIHVSPPGGETLPNIRTWFWAPVSTTTSSASGNSVSVTITAEPTNVSFTADGQTVNCPAGGTAYDRNRPDAEQHSDCVLLFRPPTREVTVTADATWSMRWAASTGESGDLGTASSSSTTSLTVVEYATAIRDS